MEPAYREVFKKQIRSIVADKFFQGYELNDFIQTIDNNKLYWWNDLVFNSDKLYFNHAELNIIGWCNVVEATQGVKAEAEFLADLAWMYKEAALLEHGKRFPKSINTENEAYKKLLDKITKNKEEIRRRLSES